MNDQTSSGSLAGIRIHRDPVEPTKPWHVSVTEPATGAELTQLVGGGAPEATRAVEAAAGVQRTWADTAVSARAAALRAVAADLREQQRMNDIAVTISRETGKRIAEARAEIGLSAAFFEWFGDAISSRHGHSWSVAPGLSHEVTQRPLGIVAVLSPWNFPVSIPARKLAPALAAGCPVLFKPSEVAPGSALRLAEIVEAHMPSGLVSTVVGDPGEVVTTWLDDPRVRGLTFTGSTHVGRTLASQTAPNFTRCVLELGGNAPFVVLDDAELSHAAELLAGAKYRNNGQSCIAANQAWVPHRFLQRFAEEFAAVTDKLVLGDPLSDETTLGPLALPSDPGRIAEVAQEAENAEATIVRSRVEVPADGYFAAPILCIEPPSDSRAAREEIFGPMTVLRGYQDLDEVVEATHADQYGLGGYVAGSAERARAIAQRLDAGIIGVNTATPNTPHVPFGGLKHSGIGYEGGQAGLDAFLTQHTVAVGGAAPR